MGILDIFKTKNEKFDPRKEKVIWNTRIFIQGLQGCNNEEQVKNHIEKWFKDEEERKMVLDYFLEFCDFDNMDKSEDEEQDYRERIIEKIPLYNEWDLEFRRRPLEEWLNQFDVMFRIVKN